MGSIIRVSSMWEYTRMAYEPWNMQVYSMPSRSIGYRRNHISRFTCTIKDMVSSALVCSLAEARCERTRSRSSAWYQTIRNRMETINEDSQCNDSTKP